jgi:hypothetical protein
LMLLVSDVNGQAAHVIKLHRLTHFRITTNAGMLL